MASVINTNIASLNAQRNLSNSQSALNNSIQRLSTGLRINSAKDDAAGLAISERFTTQINGINQAVRNANDGISLAQTAEGALSTIGNNLQRIRTLAVQSRNATNSTTDREALQKEVNQLTAEIQRVAKDTSFNGTKLLDGTFSAQTFQVGANRGETINIDSIANAQTSSLGRFNGMNSSVTLTNNTAAGTVQSIDITTGSNTKTINLGTFASDAKALANAINAAGVSGLTATAGTTDVAAGTTTSATAAEVGAASIIINDLAITTAVVENDTTNRERAVRDINNQSSVTGVIATDTGSGISLSAADGRNIVIGAATGAGSTSNATFGLAAAGTTQSATLDVAYVASGAETSISGTSFGLASTTITQTGTALSAIDITDETQIDKALTALDAALSTVSSARADLGAIQNRFTSVVSNLQVTAENLSASRSRILDTDFAEETANLTRGQILQQAGTAMLAQANSLPNTVLTLLQG